MHKDDWIPVEKKLPPSTKDVLVYNGGVLQAWCYTFWGKKVEWCCWGHRGKEIVPNVTHWMPLPEPPTK